MEDIKKYIKLNNIQDREELFEQFPNVLRNKLGRAFNQVYSLKDSKPIQPIKDNAKKKQGKLQRFQAVILKMRKDSGNNDLSDLITAVGVYEGIQLVDGEKEVIADAINKLPQYEIVNGIIKDVKPKKEIVELGALRKEIKEVNENILDFKRTVGKVFSQINPHFQEIKKMIVKNHKETIDKVIANSNKFEDLRRHITQENDLLQSRIQEVATIIYQQMNANIKVKDGRKPQ
jgi:hypothetical protein